MLHQAAELCLRSILITFSGREIKAHVLSELMQHVKRWVSELKHFFNAGNEEERKRLDRLEKAYNLSRYTNCYRISDDDLKILMKEVKNLHKEIKKHFASMMEVLWNGSQKKKA